MRVALRLASLVWLLLPAVAPPAAAQEESAKELVVIDLRPKEEKDGTALTALEGKCNKNVFRVADVASDPLKVEALKEGLTQQLGVAGDGKTLTVLNWSIYYNKQVQQSGSRLSSVGIQGYSIPGSKKERRPGSDCARNESAGGWYEGNELTGQYFPLISEFEGTFGGKPVIARVVHSPTRKIEGKFLGSADDAQEVLETVRKTAEAVALAIVQ